MNDEGRDLVERLYRETWQKARPRPTLPEPLTIHYTELTPDKPDSPLYHESETYRREVGRLLGEGNEGRWVLIKGERIVGLWDTKDEAMMAGYQQFLGQNFLVHQVQEREPLLVNIHLWRYLS